MGDLGPKQMRDYAEICGVVLAQAHARCDEDTGLLEGSVEHQILQAILPEVLIRDLLHDTRIASDRRVANWKRFKKDLAEGAFHFGPREG